MENAAEALKMAGFTLLFVTALAIAMTTIMQAKHASETILSYSDKTKYYSTIETTDNVVLENNSAKRKVSIYDIIPVLYGYQTQDYIVLFNGIDNGKDLCAEKINYNNKFYDIKFLNYDLEDKCQVAWRNGNGNNIKKHVDDIVKNLISNYSDSSFTEEIGTTNNIYLNNSGIQIEDNSQETENDSESKVTQKMVITYTKK